MVDHQKNTLKYIGSIRKIKEKTLMDKLIKDLNDLEAKFGKEYEVLWIQQTGTSEISSFYCYEPAGYSIDNKVNFILERYNLRQLNELRTKLDD